VLLLPLLPGNLGAPGRPMAVLVLLFFSAGVFSQQCQVIWKTPL
jgi:hypothetical protein